MRRTFLIPALLIPALSTIALAGCHTAVINAPSLAPRAVERRSIDLPDTASEPATPADTALEARLAPLVARAEEAHRRFERERVASENLIRRARTQPEGSEIWVQAQQSLSGLDAAQGPLRDISGEIAELRRDEANFGTGNRAAIDTAAAKVDALSEDQAQAVAALAKK